LPAHRVLIAIIAAIEPFRTTAACVFDGIVAAAVGRSTFKPMKLWPIVDSDFQRSSVTALAD
jgi:hypothetical protein